MTDAAGFLNAILADPDDYAPRLVYADWLDEHGDAERAEFIRVQVRLTVEFGEPRPGEMIVTGDRAADARETALRRRERELLSAHAADWLAGPGYDLFTFEDGSPLGWVLQVDPPLSAGDVPTIRPAHTTFRRGFVGEVHCRNAEWLVHGPKIVAHCPVTRFEPTDVYPAYGRFDNNARPDVAGKEFWIWSLPTANGWSSSDVPYAIGRYFRIGMSFYHWQYPTEADAWDALSEAAVNYARAEAGKRCLVPPEVAEAWGAERFTDPAFRAARAREMKAVVHD